MTVTDPVHVAAAVLREQFQRPQPEQDRQEALERDLLDHDRAFGLTDDTRTDGGLPRGGVA